jgi:hypothetical protein
VRGYVKYTCLKCMVLEGCSFKMEAVILEILNQMFLMETGSIVLLTRKKMVSHLINCQ